MLTASLLRYRVRKGEVRVPLLDVHDEQTLAATEALLACCRAHLGKTRGQLRGVLRAAVLELLEDWPSLALVWDGISELLLQTARFESASSEPTLALREACFEAAAEAWIAHEELSLAEWMTLRTELLGTLAHRFQTSPAALSEALYADLLDRHVLAEVLLASPLAVLHRYNLAQLQGLLRHARVLTLQAPWPRAARLRQLLRFLRFFGLLWRVSTPSGSPSRGSLICRRAARSARDAFADDRRTPEPAGWKSARRTAASELSAGPVSVGRRLAG